MRKATMLVTGSGGLVGSTVTQYFLDKGWRVIGVDNNSRKSYFGEEGSVEQQIKFLSSHDYYYHRDVDVRDRKSLEGIFESDEICAIVHAAGQPSHDRSQKLQHTDFMVNAHGTLNLLDLTRMYSPSSPFIFLSTNKVYGDNPNTKVKYEEDNTRYRIVSAEHINGINETMSVDQCIHSLFGVSKLSADMYVQEFGRYYKIPTCVLRPGCISGANQSGVKLHGFLNYLIRTHMADEWYEVIGYKGKQVRDIIHPIDIARFVELFLDNPKEGEVYNIGGGYENSCSIIEAIIRIEKQTGKKIKELYTQAPRIGDHICYYSDLTKIKRDYPDWKITIDLESIIKETINGVKSGF